MPCKDNYKQVVIMGSLLYQISIPKRFLVNALSRKEYWYKQLRLVYVYALTWKVSNCSHKLKYEDTCAKTYRCLVLDTSTPIMIPMIISDGNLLKYLRQHSYVMVA